MVSGVGHFRLDVIFIPFSKVMVLHLARRNQHFLSDKIFHQVKHFILQEHLPRVFSCVRTFSDSDDNNFKSKSKSSFSSTLVALEHNLKSRAFHISLLQHLYQQRSLTTHSVNSNQEVSTSDRRPSTESSPTKMPKIIGKSTRVVETDGFSIDEYAGNVASKDDTMSLAVVKVSKPYSEPWLTLDYDEWIAVVKGRVDCHIIDKTTQTEIKAVSAIAGETIFVEKGQRFKPVFPVADTEYIPVCIPAFKPERCKREDENCNEDEEKKIVEKLAELHCNNDKVENVNSTKGSSFGYETYPLYHMFEESTWKAAVDSGAAYFPPTFHQDGGFTHASLVPEKLIETANHFYSASNDNWVCLKLCGSELLKNKCGIVTVFEEPKNVGTIGVKDDWKDQIFPHIYGGIPVSIPGVVVETYPMKREPSSGTFLSITGLTDE